MKKDGDRKVIVFLNTKHNPKLAFHALKKQDVDLDGVIFIDAGASMEEALGELFKVATYGDMLVVGTIADFMDGTHIYSVSWTLGKLEDMDIVLVSYLESGCSYRELRARVETAQVLVEVQAGGNLSEY